MPSRGSRLEGFIVPVCGMNYRRNLASHSEEAGARLEASPTCISVPARRPSCSAGCLASKRRPNRLASVRGALPDLASSLTARAEGGAHSGRRR